MQRRPQYPSTTPRSASRMPREPKNVSSESSRRGSHGGSDGMTDGITAITPLKWQLEALVGGTWAECWQGLKSRFPEYLQQLQKTIQE